MYKSWQIWSLIDIPDGFIEFLDPQNIYFDTKLDLLSGLEAEILAVSLNAKMAAFCHLDDVPPLPK